jgi:hypothetical protein
MKLTKQEKNLLAIEKFFDDFKKDFEGISFIAISASVYENYCKNFNPKQSVYPLFIKVEKEYTKWLTYSWELGASDDENPLYTRSGERLGFYEIKAYVEQSLPEAFKGKSFYTQGTKINSDNITELTKPIKVKLSAIQLTEELPVKSDSTKKKLKI